LTTALYYDDVFLDHDTRRHPECAQRLVSIVEHLRSGDLWERCAHPGPRDATLDEIALIHDREYVEALLQMADSGGGRLDMDTIVSPGSGRAALRAAGVVVDACDRVMSGDADNALCLVRPPGHHARPARGMGFCLFNNIAIGAMHVIENTGIERVAIIDWDAHHGNGTQEAFWRDPRVFYVSLHLWPYYPGTGESFEVGESDGEGSTLNLPLSHGVTAEQFLSLFDKGLAQVADFQPEFVLISAGFDSDAGDPLAGAGLDIEDFRTLTDRVTEFAAERCHGRVVSTLEGGYNMDRLPLCVAAHLEGLLEAGDADRKGPL